MKYVEVNNIIFSGKQNIKWNEVEEYLKPYVGAVYNVQATDDRIIISSSFPGEFAWSNYTRRLRGGYAKVKANLVQVVSDLVYNADNKRWVANKDEKHKLDAKLGWYRYDVYFSYKVKSESEQEGHINYYKGTLVVKSNDHGLYLYDIINIKKEARKPEEL